MVDSFEYFPRQLPIGVRLKREIARQYGVVNDATSPNVNDRALVLFLADYLWGHVLSSSTEKL